MNYIIWIGLGYWAIHMSIDRLVVDEYSSEPTIFRCILYLLLGPIALFYESFSEK